MIDSSGKEQLFIRNPADYKSGFWYTYRVDGVPYSVRSTEKESLTIGNHEMADGRLTLELIHKSSQDGSPLARVNIEIWSLNTPMMLIRHKITNLSNRVIEDMRLYNLMDFDVGGPSSYKDDLGVYDEEHGIMSAYDDNPLCVSMSSKPEPDGWEIGAPTKLHVNNENRDLKKNLELGPRDITTALQWNHGDIHPDESKTVDIILVCATKLDETKTLIMDNWELFEKKIQ